MWERPGGLSLFINIAQIFPVEKRKPVKFTKYSEAPDLDRNGAAGGVSYCSEAFQYPTRLGRTAHRAGRPLFCLRRKATVPIGGDKKKHSRPVGGCAAGLGALLQVEERVHAGILRLVVASSISLASAGTAKARSFRCSSSPHPTRFAGLGRGPYPFDFKYGASRRPIYDGAPRSWATEKAQPPCGRLCCKTWDLTSG